MLSDPLVRGTVCVLSVVGLGYLAGFVEARAPAVVALWVVFSVTMLAVLMLQPGRSVDPRSTPRPRAWLWRLAAAVWVGSLAPVLVFTVDVDVVLFGPVFVVIAVVVLCATDRRWRMPMASWVVVVWLAALVGSGVRDPSTLALTVGGALLVVAATDSISRVLSENLAAAEDLRAAAELRAGLLSSVLRTNSLDPGGVLRAVVDGLVEVGFDMAAIRTLDHERCRARLVEGTARSETELAVDLAFAGSHIPEVIARRAPLVVEASSREDRVGAHRLTGVMHLPLFDGDHLHAIISAGLRHRSPQRDELAAAELLATQAEAALQRARAYRADAATVEQLHQVDVRIHDFISTVSHELRTPLTVVQGLGQTLLSRWDDLDPARRQDLLRRIDANAERLATMVRSLIDTSAFESGELELRPEATPLRAAIVTLLNRLVEVTGAHPVTVDVASDLVVEVDPALFQHVIENLLANVAKHTPEGTPVTISAWSCDARIVVAVHDEGTGIDAEDLPHVLDRFYRGGDPDRRATSGLGLGLALAQDIVQAHGGAMEVASEPGSGTRFSFDVPAAAAGGR